ncbi:Ig-like domain-containing protein [uncultured Nitratireductor sp.]|uniref:Ig-like domain-containing protein n=1 Tax=uncultured Nitratireductor sp. TaxID=520953 RepID=UPI0025F6E563|nr:Ig-like domain-containing protein [uncultured Nitratireductor sp.]
MNILPTSTTVDHGSANYVALASIGALDLQAEVLGTSTVGFSVEEGHTLEADFDYSALASLGVLSDYALVIQKWDGTQWTGIDGTGEATLLELGLLSGNEYRVEQLLESGQYRAFMTFDGVGVGVLGDLQVSGTDFDFTEIGGYDPVPVSGNVVTDVNDDGQVDDVTATTVVSQVNGEAVAGPGTTIVGTYGTLTIDPDGSYTYTPNAAGDGIGQVDAFTYTLNDPETGNTSTATLYVQIDSEGQGLVWNDLDPTQPATLDMAAVDDTGTAGIDTTYVVTTQQVDSAIQYTNIVGSGEGSYEFTVADQVESDLSISVSASSLLNLLDSIAFTLEQFIDGAWVEIANSSEAGLIDVIGIVGESLQATVNDLSAGQYRLGVSDSGIGVGVTVTTDVTFENSDLTQIVADGGVSTQGNVLDDDTLGSTYTVLKVAPDGINYEEPPQAGTQLVGTYGTLTIFADGSYIYEPDPDTASIGQSDVFTYQLEHPNGSTAEATLTIDIEQGAGPGTFAAVASIESFSASEDVIGLDNLDGPDEGDDGSVQNSGVSDGDMAGLLDDGSNAEVSLNGLDGLSQNTEGEGATGESADNGSGADAGDTQNADEPVDPFGHLVNDDDLDGSGSTSV